MSRSAFVVSLAVLGVIHCGAEDEAPGRAFAPAVATPGPNLGAGGVDGGAGEASATASPPSADAAVPDAAAPEPPLVGAFASPTGSASAPCTRAAPCDWKTAMHHGEAQIILTDGTYTIPAGQVFCVRDGKTVRAEHPWAAHVAFQGNADTSGDEDGPCSDGSGFGFGLHGTLMGLEITAPGRWSAVDSFAATATARSRIVDVLVHDVNLESQEYSSTYGNCVQQGALDLVDTDLVNSVVYRTGQRSGTDPIRGSSSLTTCINFQAVYVQHQTLVDDNLIVDHYGGFCVHGYKPTDVSDIVTHNTIVGCHQGGVILPIFPSNQVSANVIVNGRSDTAGPQYGACVVAYDGSTLDPARLAHDVCRGNPHDAIYSSTSGSFDTSLVDTTSDVGPVGTSAASIVQAFDAATTPAAKRAVARGLSVDRAKTGGAGFVMP